MQMQGSEAVWQPVLDAHLHCVYPGSSPPAWNARRTTVGAVVLCVCGVPLGREGESGIAAGGTASLPGGGGIAAGTEASLPSGIAAGEGVRAAD